MYTKLRDSFYKKHRMIRSTVFTRGPIFLSLFPFNNVNHYDKPANEISTPLTDELGWDRVKRIFSKTEDNKMSKELQSITNVTLSGIAIGTVIAGISTSKHVVNNFIETNEATRFTSHFDAKRELQDRVTVNFLKKGGKFGLKVGLFCFLFSSIATCTTAYRGKLRVENYILSGSVTGLALKAYLGLRGALVGATLGGVLGTIYGTVSIITLNIAGVSMDELLEVQQKWITSTDEETQKRIREHVDDETLKLKKIYEANQEARLAEEKRTAKNHNT